jgi:hypothetical protein
MRIYTSYCVYVSSCLNPQNPNYLLFVTTHMHSYAASLLCSLCVRVPSCSIPQNPNYLLFLTTYMHSYAASMCVRFVFAFVFAFVFVFHPTTSLKTGFIGHMYIIFPYLLLF